MAQQIPQTTLVILLPTCVVKIKGTIESSKNDSGDKPQEIRSWKFDNKEFILLISGQEGHWERRKTASTSMNHETHLLR